jgi:hypothetical protein
MSGPCVGFRGLVVCSLVLSAGLATTALADGGRGSSSRGYDRGGQSDRGGERGGGRPSGGSRHESGPRGGDRSHAYVPPRHHEPVRYCPPPRRYEPVRYCPPGPLLPSSPLLPAATVRESGLLHPHRLLDALLGTCPHLRDTRLHGTDLHPSHLHHHRGAGTDLRPRSLRTHHRCRAPRPHRCSAPSPYRERHRGQSR